MLVYTERGICEREKAPTIEIQFPEIGLRGSSAKKLCAFRRRAAPPTSHVFRYTRSEIYILSAQINNAILEKLGVTATGVVGATPLGMVAEIDCHCTIRNKDFGT